jgi:hypothetical protein
MKTSRAVQILAAAVLIGAIAGCSNNTVKPTSDTVGDQAGVFGALAGAPELMDDAVFDTGAQAALAPSLKGAHAASSATAAAVDPFAFWRSIVTRTRTFEFAFADTDTTGVPNTAVVTVRRHFLGTFNVVPRDPSNPDQPQAGVVIRKPLDDLWKRRFLLKRVRVAPDDRAMWRIAGATAVDVTSKDATSAITSVRVQTATKDTTLTDPDAFIRLRRVLRFATDEVVTLTVTTPRTDDVVLLYHHDRRARLEGHGDGTYTGSFPAGTFEGWRHFGVNALSHGTLYDDAAAYDSKAWIFPYVIVGGPDVDYLP